MELQLAQNDPRGQDWCKVNLLVTDKSHSGTSFSLYHLIMTLLCSGQVEDEERDFLPSRTNSATKVSMRSPLIIADLDSMQQCPVTA